MSSKCHFFSREFIVPKTLDFWLGPVSEILELLLSYEQKRRLRLVSQLEFIQTYLALRLPSAAFQWSRGGVINCLRLHTDKQRPCSITRLAELRPTYSYGNQRAHSQSFSISKGVIGRINARNGNLRSGCIKPTHHYCMWHAARGMQPAGDRFETSLNR